MGQTFFISDVHLGTKNAKSEKIKEKKLLSFLDHVATNGERLFIVGDLFDFWFEYRTVIPRGHMKVLAALARLHELGREVHYIAGNHDFWMRDFLTTELGIPVHFDGKEFVINNRRFFLHHGDGVKKKDGGYHLMKRVFRNKFNIFLYSLLHPDLGIPLAKWVAQTSRNHSSHNGPPDDRDYQELAQQKFQQGIDYVIFGHLHYPMLLPYGEKKYVNLGDWIEYFTYARFDGEDLELLRWER